MPNIVDRWSEYNAGTLTPPVAVQVDEVNGTYLVWIYTTYGGVVGPYSRSAWDSPAESEVVALADLVGAPQYQITAEDGTTVVV